MHLPRGAKRSSRMVRVDAAITPRRQGVVTALDSLRRSDPIARAAWDRREEARLRRCRSIVTQLEANGDLAQLWDVDTATRLLWALTSVRVWEELAWHDTLYASAIGTFLERALLEI